MNIYLSRDGQHLGAFPLEEVNRRLAEQGLSASDLAWHEGLSAWQPLSAISGVVIPSTEESALQPPPLPPRIPLQSGSRGSSSFSTGTSPPVVDAVKLFVGPNYTYYTRIWQLMETRASRNAWNWAAFFCGMAWMAYRKMYKYSWIFIGAMLFETLLEIAVGFPEAVSNVINIAICVTFGWQGNHLYKDYVTKRIKEITPSSVLTEEARLQIVRGGGTNIGAALGFSAALFVLLIVITAASMR